jgi:hypothetical protein
MRDDETTDLWSFDAPGEVPDAEEAWVGGVGDLGDSRAAEIVQHVEGYQEYIKILRDLIKKELGESFFLYRAMTREQLKSWSEVKPRLSYFGFSVNQAVAESWHKLAMNKGKSLIIVRGEFTPDDVLMRGHTGEKELVVMGRKINIKKLDVRF